MILDELRKSGINKQTTDQKEMIDAVIMRIWAHGHVKRSPLLPLISVLMSWIIAPLISIVFIPVQLVSEFSRIVFAVIGSIISVYILDNAEVINISSDGFLLPSALAFLIIMCLLYRKKVIQFIYNLIFDIGDLLSLGLLSRYYVKIHFLALPLTRYKEEGNELKAHLYTSRLSTGLEEMEISTFQSRVSIYFNQDNWDGLENEIKLFWNNYPEKEDFWTSLGIQ